MITKISQNLSDKNELKTVAIDEATQKDDFFDYSKVIVKKPWGYEYLIYQNHYVAVWILFIEKGFETSMHCHPQKKTSLILLSGEAICTTLKTQNKLSSSEGMLLSKGVFHSTKSISDEGVFVMEIETPINKRDLIRLKDKYGRRGKGYESQEDMAFDIQNYNYISFIDGEIEYNVKKKFGKCSILLQKYMDFKEFQKNFKLKDWDAVSILKGQILDNNKTILDIGDTISLGDIKKYNDLTIKDELEIIIIKKIDNIIKFSDYIVSFLEEENLTGIFAVPGSTNVHLMDSISRNTNMSCIFTQTEQAATTATESYSKLTGNTGITIISSGASGTNALTGVADAWTDSTPLMVISGQSNSEVMRSNSFDGFKLRQLGIQELDTISMVKNITKYSVSLKDPYMVKYHLQKAIYIATSGRPGPVWIEIPIDILGMNIDEDKLIGFKRGDIESPNCHKDIKKDVHHTIDLIQQSKRPVILVGNGVRLSNSIKEMIKLIELLKIPVLTSRRGADILGEYNSCFFGRSGAYGQRAANFIIQNSDLLISIGSRLSLPQIGRNYKAFARNAKKIIVDIDLLELRKKTINPYISIHCSAKKFILEMLKQIKGMNISKKNDWIAKCKYWKLKYPQKLEQGYTNSNNINNVNAYIFIEKLSKELREEEVITVDGGSNMVFMMQAFEFKKNQRLISSTGLENGSFALSGSIGACIGNEMNRVICICDDRGFVKNISELETIINYKFPVKIFILNNKGYSYIKKTQKKYFDGRFIGSEIDQSKSLDILKIGEAYKIPTYQIFKNSEVIKTIKIILSNNEICICDINIDKNQQITPQIVFDIKPDGRWVSRPLEDMYPFLDREDLRKNMLI